VENVIFPLVGWFKTNLAKRSKTPDPSGGYPYSLALPAETAKKSVKLVKSLIARIGPVGTHAVAPPPPPAPAPSLKKERVITKENLREEDSQEPLPKKKRTPASAVLSGVPDKPPAKKKRKDSSSVSVPEEAAAKKKKKTKVDVPPPAEEEEEEEEEEQQRPIQAAAPQPVRIFQMDNTVLEIMQAFFNAASAGMAAPGTFYYKTLCEQQMPFQAFFGPGGPADCVIPIAQMLLKKIGNK
jgi:hypothetical protein